MFFKVHLSLIAILLCFTNCIQGFESSGNFGLDSTNPLFNDSPGRGVSSVDPTVPYKSGPMIRSSYRRLTNLEVNNKLNSVFGVKVNSEGLLGEEELKPFNTYIDAQEISETQVSNIEYFSREVATQIMSDTNAMNKIKTCNPANASDSVCFNKIKDTIINNSFAKLPDNAFSQKLTTTLMGLSAESGNFNDAIEGLLMYVLQSPRFLYNSLGDGSVFSGVYRLSSIELANKISYLITGFPASPELIEDALDGKLENPNELNLIIDKLFDSSTAKAQLFNFHAMWLGFYNMQLSPSIAINAVEETQMVLDSHLIDADRPWIELLDLDHTYVNDELAKHYNYPEKNQDGFYKLSYGDYDQPRKGILAHATFLSGFPKIGDSSPTKRGYHIQKNLLCNHIPQPSADIDIDEPPKPTNGGNCKKHGYLDLQTQTACSSCHILMDNVGFALENFNHLGQYRTVEDKDNSCTIDGEGSAAELGSFTGLNGFSNALYSERNTVQNCLVERKLLFTYGFNVKEEHPKYLQNMQSKFSQHGNYKQLLKDIITSTEFKSLTWN